MNIGVRQAILEDTKAISALHHAHISVWQRLDEGGRVQDVAYDALSLYERWLHGGSWQGAWMSVETGAIFLNHLLLGAGLPLVAFEDNGPAKPKDPARPLLGYCECYINHEPEPLGIHLHIASILTAAVPEPAGDLSVLAVTRALLEDVIARARRLRCTYITFNRGDHQILEALASFEGGPQAEIVQSVQRFSLSARTGQIFYKVTEHLDADALQIAGWAMPAGRITSSRHHWETQWTPIWNTLPELRARHQHRLRIASGGQDAFAFVQQQLYNPRAADVSLWAVKTLTAPILAGLRDWAHREGYRTLALTVTSETARLFSAEADAEAFTALTYAVPLA